eukprot:358848-Chlamydomonas_euryale.AAC.9
MDAASRQIPRLLIAPILVATLMLGALCRVRRMDDMACPWDLGYTGGMAWSCEPVCMDGCVALRPRMCGWHCVPT